MIEKNAFYSILELEIKTIMDEACLEQMMNVLKKNNCIYFAYNIHYLDSKK